MIFNICAGAPILPIGKFTYNETEYAFNGQSELEVSGVFKYQPDSSVVGGWRMWVYKTCSIDFTAFPRSATTQYCAIGMGQGPHGGGSWGGGSDTYHEVGNSGGDGGKHKTDSFVANGTLSIEITDSGTKLKNGVAVIADLGVGGGAAGGRGAHSLCYPNGTWVHDYDAGGGSNGAYAFNGEENSAKNKFDSILYAPGGGGAGTWWSPSSARGSGSTAGSPGTGGGTGTSATQGCVLFWCKGI